MKLKRIIAGILVVVMCFTCVQFQAVDTNAATGTYWIKVNYQQNVATVYEKQNGTWVPIKAMLTSCGTNTPRSGTFSTSQKLRWHTLMGPSYGQYCTRIVGSILFHSVWYYQNGNRRSQSVAQFNKLGTTASHGCVRLSTGDSKWVYDNCDLGTKVTFYKSSDPGPLGKPGALKMPSSAGGMNWDPTDKSASNPYYQTAPVIKQKYKTITYGSTNDTPAEIFTVRQNNGQAVRSVSYSVTKYNAAKKKYVSAKFSSTSVGTYKIKCTAVGQRGVSLTDTYKVVVKDLRKPVINAEDKTVGINSKNAVEGMTAKMLSGVDRTKTVKVYVKEPGEESYGSSMSYTTASKYQFRKLGDYKVKYVVSNKNNTKTTTTKEITVTVKGPSITMKYKKITRGVGYTLNWKTIEGKWIKGVDHAGNKINLTVTGKNKIDTSKEGTYVVTYKATENGYTVEKTFTIEIKDIVADTTGKEEGFEDGMTLSVPAMDAASVQEAVEKYVSFTFNGKAATAVYTVDKKTNTCKISFKEVPATTYTLNLNIAE